MDQPLGKYQPIYSIDCSINIYLYQNYFIHCYLFIFFRKVLFWDDLVYPLVNPRAIAVAPYDGLMFWTDWHEEFPKIERASMDGNPDSRLVIINATNGWPNGLTLDYQNRFLYWVDAKAKHIARSDWNGNYVKILYRDGRNDNVLQRPFAISVHQSLLFWTDFDDK